MRPKWLKLASLTQEFALFILSVLWCILCFQRITFLRTYLLKVLTKYMHMFYYMIRIFLHYMCCKQQVFINMEFNPLSFKVQVYCIFSQVYNSKQHEMQVQHFKYFSMAVTLLLDCWQSFSFLGFNSLSCLQLSPVQK